MLRREYRLKIHQSRDWDLNLRTITISATGTEAQFYKVSVFACRLFLQEERKAGIGGIRNKGRRNLANSKCEWVELIKGYAKHKQYILPTYVYNLCMSFFLISTNSTNYFPTPSIDCV